MDASKRSPAEGWFTTSQSRWARLARRLWANWITSAGAMLALVAIILLVGALFLHLYNAILHREAHPYVGLIIFMALPALLIAGLALILIGDLVQRGRLRRDGADAQTTVMSGVSTLPKVAIFGGIMAISLVGFGSFSYEAYHYTDSTGFCLKVCHQVMEPEGVAYARSPHANVPCVSCHIGPGASWFVRSKMSGLRQVVAVLRDSYSRPIPTPVHNLRPARETCEVCHWPAKFHGSKLLVKEHYQPDEGNSPTVSALVLKVGGTARPNQAATGVHWHVDPGNQVRFRTVDEKWQDIVEVIQTTPDGEIRYLKNGADPNDAAGTWRTMDCIDCHNRPTHISQLPDDTVDAAMAAGQLDAGIPYLRREAVRALREVQPGENTAARISSHLSEIYRQEHPAAQEALQEQLPSIVAYLTGVLEGNVFPQMNITWGTYPNNLSHFDEEGELGTGGCFRCHDEEHVSADGATISQDCDACHAMMAWRESDWSDLPDFVTNFLANP